MRSRCGIGSSPIPSHEFDRLAAVAAGVDLSEIRRGHTLGPRERAHLDVLVSRRVAGEPLQYLEGSAPFGPVNVRVDERVLVPRPETEQLFEMACSQVTDPGVIVDLCTGSGALALALARQFPRSRVVATDIDHDALDVARTNLDRVAEVRQGDLFAALDPAMAGQVDLLVANPPYVSEAEWSRLPPDVRREPVVALVAGPTGRELVERIFADARRWLSWRGVLLCEIGETHAPYVAGLLAAGGLVGEARDDLSGRSRFVVARVSP